MASDRELCLANAWVSWDCQVFEGGRLGSDGTGDRGWIGIVEAIASGRAAHGEARLR